MGSRNACPLDVVECTLASFKILCHSLPPRTAENRRVPLSTAEYRQITFSKALSEFGLRFFLDSFKHAPQGNGLSSPLRVKRILPSGEPKSGERKRARPVGRHGSEPVRKFNG